MQSLQKAGLHQMIPSILDFPALDPRVSASLKQYEHPLRALTEGHIPGQ